MAQQTGQLERVTVKTREWGQEQKDAIHRLKARFSKVGITFELKHQTAHDRTIELLRGDGHEARVIMGVGLEFIESQGTVRPTFLVFQDPYGRNEHSHFAWLMLREMTENRGRDTQPTHPFTKVLGQTGNHIAGK